MTMQDQIAPIGYIKLPTVSFIQNTKKNYYFISNTNFYRIWVWFIRRWQSTWTITSIYLSLTMRDQSRETTLTKTVSPAYATWFLSKVRSPKKNHYLPVKLIESSLDDPVLLYSLKTIRSLFQIRWTIIRVKPESWCRQIRCALSPKPTVFRTKTFQTKEAFASLKEQNTHHMLYAFYANIERSIAMIV